MTTIRIVSVENPEFHQLPESVYLDDPFQPYCQPDRTVASLSRPEFAELQRPMLALNDSDRPVARLAARISPSLTDRDGHPLGMISFFEALNEPAATRQLFSAAFDYFQSCGIRTVIGPIDGDTWHKYRLNAGPYDTPPFLFEPYNPPYYPALWEASGFDHLQSYHSKSVTDLPPILPVMQRYFDRAFHNGYRFRNFDIDQFDAELDLLYALSCRIFAGNFLYTAIPSDEFKALYTVAKPLIIPDLCWFAFDSHNQPVGFLFAFPEPSRQPADTINMKTVGTVPECRGAGVAATLMYLGYQNGVARNLTRANLCLFADGNPSGQMDAGAGTLSRRYTLYAAAIPE